MTTTNNTHICFSFRSKFQKRLLNEENRSAFVVAFDRFCNYHKELAKKVLWRLTYNEDFFEQDLKPLGLDLEIVPLNMISTLRDELRFQYNIQNPGFLEPQLPDNAECMEAFTALKNHTDEIVAIAVLDYCYNTLYVGEESKQKILRLLGKPEENLYFGGLREMGFSRRAASYLMPYHIQIRDLFKALYDYTFQNSSPFKNTPFEELAQQLTAAVTKLPFKFTEDIQTPADEAHVEEEEPAQAAEPQAEEPAQPEKPVQAAEPQVEEPVKPCSEFKPLTPENILEHCDVFYSLFYDGHDSIDTLLGINMLGFDLNKIILRQDAILKVLEANEKFRDVDEMLRSAKSLQEEAENEMAMATKALAE